MNKPLDKHDVRQSAYRGTDDQAPQTGIPDGKERRDPSAEDTELPEDTIKNGDDRSGETQPNMGQAGSYGDTDEETEVTSRNRSTQKNP
jgi:hypothetical protein